MAARGEVSLHGLRWGVLVRQLRWDVPFADRSPLDLQLIPISLDQHGWWVDVEASRDRPGKWRLHFVDVLGFKFSNESFFDWTAWADRLEATHQASAYIVENGSWRDEFWNGRNAAVLRSIHYVIASGDCLVECLAGRFEVFPEGFVPSDGDDARLTRK